MSIHTVAFWNVENLFAPEDYPDRPEWLAKRISTDLKGWTADLFALKVNQIAAVITGMNAAEGPDILGLCEVENRFVLDALCEAFNQLLPSRKYTQFTPIQPLINAGLILHFSMTVGSTDMIQQRSSRTSSFGAQARAISPKQHSPRQQECL